MDTGVGGEGTPIISPLPIAEREPSGSVDAGGADEAGGEDADIFAKRRARIYHIDG